MRNKILLSFFAASLLYGNDTCYSVQLLSSNKPFNYKSSFPQGAKIMHINRTYTLRYGCFDQVRDAKPALRRLKRQFPQAYIVSTYRYRFKDGNSHTKSLQTFKKDLYFQPANTKKKHPSSLQKEESNIEEEIIPSPPIKTIVTQDATPQVSAPKQSIQKVRKKSCFTIDLIESQNPIDNANLPLGTKIIQKYGMYIAQYGCFDTVTQAKPTWQRLKKEFPEAIIIPTTQEIVEETTEKLGPIHKRFQTIHTLSPLQQKPKSSLPKPSFYKKVPTAHTKQSNCSSETEKNIVACRDKCIENKKNYPWENIDLDAVESYVNALVEQRIPKLTIPKSSTRSLSHILIGNEENTTYPTPQEKLNFYTTASLNINYGQTDTNGTRLDNQSLTVTAGLKYKYYFLPLWYFFTDDRALLYLSKSKAETKFDVKELYISSDGLFDNQANFLIGRKYLKDKRAWYYKTSLDSVGIFNKHDLLLYELYGGTRLTDSIVFNTGEDESLVNLKDTKFLIGHLSYEYLKDNTIEGFYIHEDGNLKNADWVGIRMQGKIERFNQDKISYWADVAHANGSYKRLRTITTFPPITIQENKKIQGLGFDIGGKYTFTRYNSAIAASVAYGSGGGNLYRQPSLTNNRSNYLSKDISFRRYGSFFNPELSNMWISSVYFVHHLWGGSKQNSYCSTAQLHAR